MDDADRLRQILEHDERIPAPEYIALLRSVSRAAPLAMSTLPQDPHRFALRQAFLDGDPASILEAARFAAAILDASGQPDRAIASLDQAVAMVTDHEAAAELLLARAWFEGAAGRVDQARLTIERAQSLGPTAALRPSALAVAVRCITLVEADPERCRSMASRARAEGTDPVASSLMVQLISLTAATGAIADARADARLLLEYATEVGHVARQLDARGALLALEGRSELVHEGISELQDEARRVMNVHPIWKTLIACYRSDVVRGDEADAEYVHRLLIDERPRVNRAYHNSFDGLAAFGSQLDDPGELLDLAPPTTPTLFSLPNVLASAEAVAIGGSLCNAAEWIAWLGAELPAYVVTSLEWPACRARIEALLWLRLGQRSEAIERLRRAVACCEERGDVIEAEIGRAQLAAIEGDAAAATQARQRLAEFGIDASRLAGAADRVVERARLAGEQPFTVDEGRALARLVRGCSQREIEAELELRPRGAARLLTSSYRKLGVRGRIAAIEAARERQVA